MTPGYYLLELYCGDTTVRQFVLWDDAAKTLPTDLAGATATAEVRDRPGGSMLLTFDCAISSNVITATLPASAWHDWGTVTNAVWDLQVVYADGTVTTVLTGVVAIAVDVTYTASVAS